ncbi:MAG: hypothetical protein JSR59_13845 [Proteobacteria bacterium]|nr:hypothetical protein [Pseudomonadota bacterium]
MSTFRFGAIGAPGTWRGSARADIEERSGFPALLAQRGLMRDDECLVGIELGTATDDKEGDHAMVHGLLVFRAGHEPPEGSAEGGGALPVRKVSVRLTPTEFVAAFGSLAVTLSADGVLEGRSCEFLD